MTRDREDRRHDFRERLREILEVRSSIVCGICGDEEIDLSPADDVDDALEIWDDHVADVHDDHGGEPVLLADGGRPIQFCETCGEPVFGSVDDVTESVDVVEEPGEAVESIDAEAILEELRESEVGDTIESLPDRPLSVDEVRKLGSVEDVDRLEAFTPHTHFIASPDPDDVDEEGSR